MKQAAIKAGVELRSLRRYLNGKAPEGWVSLIALLELYGALNKAKLPTPSAEELTREIAKGEVRPRVRPADDLAGRRPRRKRPAEPDESP